MKIVGMIALILTLFVLSLQLFVNHTAHAAASETAKKPQTVAYADSQASVKAPDESFTGDVWIDALFAPDGEIAVGAAYVTFEPGARTNWHTHPAGQRMIVTSGVGLTQEWGGPIVEIKTGDVVSCPANVKHWHGASPTIAMTHIAVTGFLGGEGVEWMEPVSEEQYRQYEGK